MFDLKDVWDLVIQGLNAVASGSLVSSVSGFWGNAPAALQVVYAVGTFMTAFGLVSLVKGRMRGTVPALRQKTEHRPKEGVAAVPRREATLTDEDGEAMQDFRVLWNRHGSKPAETLGFLFENVAHRLVNFGGPYWTELLAPEVYRLRDARLAMDSSVAPDSQLNTTELKKQFEELWSAYLNGVKWIARLMHNGDLVLEKPEAGRLERWKGQHFVFYDKLHDMHEKPLYKGNLKIERQIGSDDQPYADLLAEAERRVGSTPSTPDTEVMSTLIELERCMDQLDQIELLEGGA